ncbi:Flavin reductase [Rubrivivax sp. A210]|uniref:flavin reductase family protein n=1 Tax=Rubrivivax sp. A210 TaxID=2772301 RepID=UPI00191AD9E7|nr:flavin reductase family protein [Rubrivivax sp. A210]CAD5373701.1 Flavin reductase [Rubrivivax sp. A210]
MDKRRLRTALGRFATGVTIVSCVDEGGRWVGLTVSSFSSLSLEPPLVLWSLRQESPNLAAFEAAPRFAVNVLAEAQIGLSRRFASSHDHRFGEGEWALGAHGQPVLKDAVAVFECETVTRQDAGDHRLYIGRVLAFAEHAHAPLLYRSGHYHSLGETL